MFKEYNIAEKIGSLFCSEIAEISNRISAQLDADDTQHTNSISTYWATERLITHDTSTNISTDITTEQSELSTIEFLLGKLFNPFESDICIFWPTLMYIHIFL